MKKKNNYYWMYSKHSIENALLNQNRNILEIIIEKKFSNFYENYFKIYDLNKNIKISIVTKKTIVKKIGKLAKYQGVALLVEKLSYDRIVSLDPRFSKESFIIIIDQLNDIKNFGALLRVAYAFGVKTIITLDRFMPDENGYLASIASGALDKINIFKVTNLTSIINYFKKDNWWIIGLESKKLDNCVDLKRQKNSFEKKVLIIGSESIGLRSLVRKNCDILYRISTKNEDLDSINLVQAASIALYELT